MAAVIHKYELPLTTIVEVEMPRGAKILSLQVQRGVVCLWASHEDGAVGMEKRKFLIVGTGYSFLDYGCDYVATVMTSGGDYVWHIYEATGGDADN